MKYLFLTALILFNSCSGAQEDEAIVPPELIPLEQFAAVMTDVQLLEATFNQKMVREDDPVLKMAEYYDQVFTKHGVEKDQFQTSYSYWSSRPQDMMKVYELMIDELTRQEGKINSINREAPLGIDKTDE